jgi:ribulose 1,5-bisphosphate synthetase/thiazole synthase
MEAKVVVSTCGHDGPMGAHSVKRLAKLGMVPEIPGMAALDMNAAEDRIVGNTREVVPGMVLAGEGATARARGWAAGPQAARGWGCGLPARDTLASLPVQPRHC